MDGDRLWKVAGRLMPDGLAVEVDSLDDGALMRAVVWSSQSDDWLWMSVPLAVSDYATAEDREHARAMMAGAGLLWAHEYAGTSPGRAAAPGDAAANTEHPPASHGAPSRALHRGPTTPDDERTGTVRALLAAVESCESTASAQRYSEACDCSSCITTAALVEALSGLRAAVWRVLQP